MADEPKTTEPGWIEKARATIQHGELKAIETVGGKEAAELTAMAFEAGNEGKPLERARLGIAAEAAVAGHVVDTLKAAGAKIEHSVHKHLAGVALGGGLLGLPGALAGRFVEDKITGGETVSEPAPASPGPGKVRDQSPHK